MSTLEYVIKDGVMNMDFSRVTAMLATSYWSPGIRQEEVIRGARQSAMVIGAFLPEGTQIGYARVISDKTRFAYILDVFVEEKYRRNGIGQALITYILNHTELKDVYQWMLGTKDAHGVYKKLGFDSLKEPSRWMEIRHPRPQR